MEPTVKSEPCEDLYREQEGVYQISNVPQKNLRQSQPQNNLKRVHEEVGNTSIINADINQHQTNNTYCTSLEFPNVPQQTQDCFNVQESDQTLEVKPLKKYKRLEENVLFHPPFFNLVESLQTGYLNDAIAARCYSCGKVVKGNRGISSNFIKHMKRSHQEVYKIYDGYKTHKIKSYQLPNVAKMLALKSDLIVESGASGSDSTTVNSNDDINQLFDTSNVSETNDITTNDSSDYNEDSAAAITEVGVSSEHIELSSKTIETLENLMDEKLKAFAKQKEYDDLIEKVNALTSHHKSSDCLSPALAQLKTEVDNLKKECLELRLEVQKSHASKRQLQNELQIVDKLLHKRKLIIRNIPVLDPGDPLKSVEKLFKETLHLDDIKIINCCIIPSAKSLTASNKEIISIELASPQDSKAIFRQTRKLKSTGIFIEPEISSFQRKRKNKLMVLRKELLRRKPELKVLVRDTTLVINGKNFYWDDVEGLCYDFKYETTELNGVEYLKLLTGLDLKEFVIVLQNYSVQIT